MRKVHLGRSSWFMYALVMQEHNSLQVSFSESARPGSRDPRGGLSQSNAVDKAGEVLWSRQSIVVTREDTVRRIDFLVFQTSLFNSLFRQTIVPGKYFICNAQIGTSLDLCGPGMANGIAVKCCNMKTRDSNASQQV
jgi:hypothetical protein